MQFQTDVMLRLNLRAFFLGGGGGEGRADSKAV